MFHILVDPARYTFQRDWPEVVKVADQVARDAVTAAALPHPHLAAFHGVVMDSDGLYPKYLVTEHSDLTLRDFLAQHALSVTDVWVMLRGILSAVAHLHSNALTHQRISLSNVLLFPDAGGSVFTAKLAEFGVAHKVVGIVTKKPLRWTDTQLNASLYLAPELKADVRGVLPFPASADVFSFGVLLAEAVALATRHGVTRQCGTDTTSLTLETLLSGAQDCMARLWPEVLPLALQCVSTSPADRLSGQPLVDAFSGAAPLISIPSLYTVLLHRVDSLEACNAVLQDKVAKLETRMVRSSPAAGCLFLQSCFPVNGTTAVCWVRCAFSG